MEADILIIGGGIGGLSLAAALAPHRRVLLLEAEDALGRHSSGRSATFAHFGIGNAIVRALTAQSRAFFLGPPDSFSGTAIARRASALFVATPSMLDALDALHAAMRPHARRLRSCGEAELRTLVPPLRTSGEAAVRGLLDPDGLRLDAEALLQGFARNLRQRGGTLLTGQRLRSVSSKSGGWEVVCEDGAVHRAPVLVNAAGAWADEVAALAGIPALGLMPLRRTMIVVDPPEEADARDWPFVKTVVDDFYMLPEGGRLIASPVDEVPSAPCDAQPEEHDVALAAAKVEQYTSIAVRRVAHRWAGLRTFAPDRTPVIGFDPRASGFFWLAGQGGFGLQTAPAAAEAAASLLLGTHWPEGLAIQGVAAHVVAPERLIDG